MPRAGLGLTAVIAAGADLADEVGLQGVTMGVLAERLGVRTPSLYKHVESLDAVQRGIGLQATRDLGVALARAAVGRSGVDAVRAIADAYRKWVLAHPGRYAATVRAPGADDEDYVAVGDEAVAILYDAVAGFELSGERAVDAVRALRSIVHGFVSLEIGGAFQLERDAGDSYRFLVDTLIAGLQAEAADASKITSPRSSRAKKRS
ncbi:TetR family transcriptional regulator [Microlunatus endophyticus]|uniref:TetR family transcriptional regulator n=1 Tax=Microlunatus endophyticus TaxID=1716077 RepID=A0A917W4W6_9ACTN|nr:TetR/AcrR family transcriptional regulator [Microlunatus endophyticus]GGL68869.1 TetR family transcriptional regulator [Microlunatus endophyticus]